MNRRQFHKTVSALLAASVLPNRRIVAAEPHTASSSDHIHAAVPTGPPQQIAMLIHPSFILLDLFGPQAVFALLGNVNVHLVWKTRAVVMAATGVPIQPTTTFTDCPKDLDVLFVPGGLEGGTSLMNDLAVVDFLHDRSSLALANKIVGYEHGQQATWPALSSRSGVISP